MVKTKKESARTRSVKNHEYRKKSNVQVAVNDSCTFSKFPFTLSSKDLAIGKHFNELCTTLSWISCNNCNQSFPNLVTKRGLCNQCNKNPFTLTAKNNIDPGPVPDELTDLTYIEQMLIAQVHPIVSVFGLKGGQYAHKGNVINFKQDIASYISKLPVHPKDLPSTLVFRKDTKHGIAEFRVRSSRIHKALIWLKENNIYYRHIEISLENLALLPEDNDITPMLQSIEIPNNELDIITDDINLD